MTQEKWQAVYGNATEQFKDKAQSTINTMRKKPRQGIRFYPAWGTLGVVALVVALMTCIPTARDKTQQSSVPLTQSPFEAVAAKTVSDLDSILGYTISDEGKTLIDNEAIFPAIQTKYADVVVEKAIWDGYYVYFQVMAKAKKGYYFDSPEAENQEQQPKPLCLAVLNADKSEDVYTMSLLDPSGVGRSCGVTSSAYYGTAEADLTLEINILEHVLGREELSRISQDTVTVKLPLMKVPAQYDGWYDAYLEGDEADSVSLPKGRVQGASVEAISTPLATYVMVLFDLVGIDSEDTGYVVIEWVDENGEPYDKGLIDPETILADRMGDAERHMIYKAQTAMPEYMRLRFTDKNTGKVIDTVCVPIDVYSQDNTFYNRVYN